MKHNLSLCKIYTYLIIILDILDYSDIINLFFDYYKAFYTLEHVFFYFKPLEKLALVLFSVKWLNCYIKMQIAQSS